MRKTKALKTFISILLAGIVLCSCQSGKDSKNESWTFVSMPDFLNVDCDYPQEGWEDALSSILAPAKSENPDFLVVPGDLVMGHWDAPVWNDEDTIAKYSDRYYTAWKSRMDHHGLKFCTSIGDHEIGDNPWRQSKKLKAVKIYKDAFARHMKMARNGPEHMKGTAFWWRRRTFCSFPSMFLKKAGAIREIELMPHGEHLWQTKRNRPLEYVTITDENRAGGFYPVGYVMIGKTDGKKFVNRRGYFLKEYESGDERAVPIFRKDNKQGLPVELPEITIKQ